MRPTTLADTDRLTVSAYRPADDADLAAFNADVARAVSRVMGLEGVTWSAAQHDDSLHSRLAQSRLAIGGISAAGDYADTANLVTYARIEPPEARGNAQSGTGPGGHGQMEPQSGIGQPSAQQSRGQAAQSIDPANYELLAIAVPAADQQLTVAVQAALQYLIDNDYLAQMQRVHGFSAPAIRTSNINPSFGG